MWTCFVKLPALFIYMYIEVYQECELKKFWTDSRTWLYQSNWVSNNLWRISATSTRDNTDKLCSNLEATQASLRHHKYKSFSCCLAKALNYDGFSCTHQLKKIQIMMHKKKRLYDSFRTISTVCIQIFYTALLVFRNHLFTRPQDLSLYEFN